MLNNANYSRLEQHTMTTINSLREELIMLMSLKSESLGRTMRDEFTELLRQ